MGYSIPKRENVLDLLSPFFGDDLTVEAIEGNELQDDYVAIFIDPEDKPVAVGTCDSAFAAYSGAAFSMIPKDVAEEALGEGDISGMIADNLRELMNICSRLLMTDFSPHLRLDQVVPKAEAECLADITGRGRRAVFDVEVPRYGRGKLSFVAV